MGNNNLYKIQEKVFLENRIIQIQENFYNFFNMIPDLLFVLDFEGNIVEVNDSVLSKLNYSRKELIGNSVFMLRPKDKIEEVKQNIDHIRRQEIPHFDIPVITKDAHIFPVEIRASEGLWNGQPAIFAVVKDVSQLSISQDKFSKAFNNSGISMFISKFETGEFIEVNDTFLEYIGYSRDEVIGNTTLDLQMTRDYDSREEFKHMIETHNKISDLEIKLISVFVN